MQIEQHYLYEQGQTLNLLKSTPEPGKISVLDSLIPKLLNIIASSLF